MQYVFLLYAPRSGSTVFSRILSESFSNCLVMPESRLVYWLMVHGNENVKSMNQDELCQLFRLDYQLSNLHFTHSDLKQLSTECAGLEIAGIVDKVSNLYAQKINLNLNHEIVIIKSGVLIRHVKSIVNVFPQATFLHIYRDPRAVVNSQSNSMRPYSPGEKMGRNSSWYGATYWKKYQLEIDYLVQEGFDILPVKYEEMVSDQENVLDKISHSLNLKRSNKVAKQYFEVHGAEKSIHQNVNKSLDQQRIEAWKTELDTKDGVAIEFLTMDQFKSKNYKTYYIQNNTKLVNLALITNRYTKHLFAMGAYWFRRLIYYSKNTGRIIPTFRSLIKSRK